MQTCPVCLEPLPASGAKTSLECGHSVCTRCFSGLVLAASDARVRCPLCRATVDTCVNGLRREATLYKMLFEVSLRESHRRLALLKRSESLSRQRAAREVKRTRCS